MNNRFLFALTSTTCATILFASVHDARAAGIALDVQSGRGTGMASAVTGFIDDSSAIYYNPAGIAQGKGLDVQAGLTTGVAGFSYTSPAGKETTVPFSVVTPFQVYGTYGLTENFTVGIGVFNPYGTKLAWPDGWEGRRQITSESLRTYYFNPTVAAHFGPVRFGAGFQLVRATVDLHRNVAFGSQEGTSDFGGAAWGVGANAGVQLEAIKKYLNFGVAYRSAVKTDFDDGKAHFGNVPAGLTGLLHDQKITTSITNPDQLAIAVATHPIDGLVIDAEVVWFGWGKFRSIEIKFPNDPTGSLTTKEAKNWSNSVNYHVGAEGRVHKNWLVRGGVLYDPTPSPSNTLLPDVPDADRLNFAVGGTYQHDSGFHVDLGYQFIHLLKAHSDAPAFPGDYAGNINILGLSVGYIQPKKVEVAAAPAPSYDPPPSEASPSEVSPSAPPATNP